MFMKPEDIPLTRSVEIVELKERISRGENFLLGERLEFNFEGAPASSAGSYLTLKALELLEDEEKSVVREDGKGRYDSIDVVDLEGISEVEVRTFFEDYTRQLLTIETLADAAPHYRERAGQHRRAARAEMTKLNMKLMQLIREIDIGKGKIKDAVRRKIGLGKFFSSDSFQNLKHNVLEPACENHALLLVLSYDRNYLDRALDVLGLTAAILNRVKDRFFEQHSLSAGERAEFEELHAETMRIATMAAPLSGVPELYFAIHNRNGGLSDEDRAIYPIRDLAVPQGMFTIVRPNGGIAFIDGIDARVLEAIEQSRSRRDGRVFDFGDRGFRFGDRDLKGNIVFLPQEVFETKDANYKLWERVSKFMGAKEQGRLEGIEYISTPINQAIYLADRWLRTVGHNPTKLDALRQLKKISEERGTCARPDYVDALISIISDRYVDKKRH